MRGLVGGLTVVLVIAVIAFPIGWVSDEGWSLSEPVAASAVQCPTVVEWMGLGGDVEGAVAMPAACRGPLRSALLIGAIGVLVSILTMGLDRFFSHDATT